MKDIIILFISSVIRQKLYCIGVTNDLERRIREHDENCGKKETFAGKYFCYNFIYFEAFNDIREAIEREKEIKGLSREKKEVNR